MIRVLVVDDSAFARKVLRESLSERQGFSVVGHARDGLEALELITQLAPDVVTLDLVMPNLDGIGLLKALRDLAQPPRVVVVSMANADTALGVEALENGAFDLVQKPTGLASDRLYDLGEELRQKVRAAAAGRMPEPAAEHPSPSSAAPVLSTTRSVVVIGTSTGGPPALTRLLRDMPSSFPVPVVMVLHIPVGYTEALAQRLDRVCALSVLEASEGLEIRAGMAVLAQAGKHLRLERRGEIFVARLSSTPLTHVHRPSVDVLFESVASEGKKALGVVLTGMGDDGRVGAEKLRASGGTVLTEAETTCVVYGMPRAVREAKLSHDEAPIDRMAELILRYL